MSSQNDLKRGPADGWNAQSPPTISSNSAVSGNMQNEPQNNNNNNNSNNNANTGNGIISAGQNGYPQAQSSINAQSGQDSQNLLASFASKLPNSSNVQGQNNQATPVLPNSSNVQGQNNQATPVLPNNSNVQGQNNQGNPVLQNPQRLEQAQSNNGQGLFLPQQGGQAAATNSQSNHSFQNAQGGERIYRGNKAAKITHDKTLVFSPEHAMPDIDGVKEEEKEVQIAFAPVNQDDAELFTITPRSGQAAILSNSYKYLVKWKFGNEQKAVVQYFPSDHNFTTSVFRIEEVSGGSLNGVPDISNPESRPGERHHYNGTQKVWELGKRNVMSIRYVAFAPKGSESEPLNELNPSRYGPGKEHRFVPTKAMVVWKLDNGTLASSWENRSVLTRVWRAGKGNAAEAIFTRATIDEKRFRDAKGGISQFPYPNGRLSTPMEFAGNPDNSQFMREIQRQAKQGQPPRRSDRLAQVKEERQPDNMAIDVPNHSQQDNAKNPEIDRLMKLFCQIKNWDPNKLSDDQLLDLTMNIDAKLNK